MVTTCTDPCTTPQSEPLFLHREGDGRGPWTRTWLRVPERGFVSYVIFGAGGDVLYVGQTRRPRERLREHAKSWGSWFHLARAVLLFPAASEVDARMAEAGLIDRLHPKYNGRLGRLARGEWGRIRNLLAAEYDGLLADGKLHREDQAGVEAR